MQNQIIVAIGLSLLLGRASLAGPVVIDQNFPANSDGVWEFGQGDQGSLINVSISGKLNRIDLPIGYRETFGGYNPNVPIPPGDLLWSIRPVVNGLPTSNYTPPLASGFVPGSTFLNHPALTSIDVSPFSLYFDSGMQFALTLKGPPVPDFYWFSYRGYNAPPFNTFRDAGIDWVIWPTFNSTPPYCVGHITYVELVPEPSLVVSCFISLLILSFHRASRCDVLVG
jgi:hypothetical protein